MLLLSIPGWPLVAGCLCVCRIPPRCPFGEAWAPKNAQKVIKMHQIYVHKQPALGGARGWPFVPKLVSGGISLSGLSGVSSKKTKKTRHTLTFPAMYVQLTILAARSWGQIMIRLNERANIFCVRAGSKGRARLVRGFDALQECSAAFGLCRMPVTFVPAQH
eukprot:gene22792-biopygen19281